jgi:hypothetical protein
VAELTDAIGYICSRYPYAQSLPLNTLTKILYLADWRAALTLGRQITRARWFVNESGPYTPDVVSVLSDRSLCITKVGSLFGRKSLRVSIREQVGWRSLTVDEKQVLDFVLATVSSKHWTEFTRLVDSTYPIFATQADKSPLDLLELAQRYKQEPVSA